MTEQTILLPTPRNLELTGGTFHIPEDGTVLLDGQEAQALMPMARSLLEKLRAKAGFRGGLVPGSSPTTDQVQIALRVAPGSVSHEQGYSLAIRPEGVDLRASTANGLFYGVQTLRQLLEQHEQDLPTLRCQDWPDFPNRGVMLDISRDKVPTMDTLYALVDLLASWKINQFQLYTEHTFAYQRHPEVWADASPMTEEQIRALDAYCSERFIELVPNQNTFGHMRRWLIHDRYRHLAECPDGCETRWGYFDEPFSLNPSEPGSLELVCELLDELLPHFSSRHVNVGCDETVDLGQGRSRELVEKLGVGRVYFDYLMKVYQEVKKRGRTMQFWGDIIIEHPELVPELPQDLLALEWGYEADHPFDEHGAAFAASGVPFYVCGGTSSWNTIAGRADNTLGNLRNAAENGRKHGAVGYLITDWGDNGHWQPLPVSYLGFGYGAALAWNYEANLGLDIIRALDAYAFRDATGVMGRLAYELGNVHRRIGLQQHNSTVLFTTLQSDPEEMLQALASRGDLADLAGRFRATLADIDEVMGSLSEVRMQRDDADLVRDEYSWAADMLRHACQRALWMIGKGQGETDLGLQERLAGEAQELMARFREVWMARNRPGGFRESLARMQAMHDSYLAG